MKSRQYTLYGKIRTLTLLIAFAPILCGCGSVGGFIGDVLPAWAGGLPSDAPPRPTDPRYPEYERIQRAKAIGETPANSAPAKSDPAK